MAKTDKVDAEGLAAFGSAFSPFSAPAPSENQKILAAGGRRRDRLVANLTAEKNALEKASDPICHQGHPGLHRIPGAPY